MAYQREDIKKQEKPERASILDGITKGQASLISAYKISKKAVKVGFEWTNDNELWEQFASEIKEFKEAKTQENKEEELGDILFTVVNIARRNNIGPEQALIKTNEKFTARFKEMEKLAKYYDMMNKIKKFNYKKIYSNPRFQPFMKYAELVINAIFDFLLGYYDK